MMIVLYTCMQCGAVDRSVLVPYREPDEDVVAWVRDVVGGTCARDHDLKSPGCRITAFANIKIPMPPGTESIGRPPMH